MLGEVSPGGTGSGLYGMLIAAIVTVFVAGLMVGRTPEYLGKKIGAREMKLVSLYILTTPALVLLGLGAAMATETGRSSMLNPGAHGLSEVLYAFASAANNNGSAFAGLSANTDFYNVALAVAMLLGRFLPICFVLALAGSLAQQGAAPASAGHPAHPSTSVRPAHRRRHPHRGRAHLRSRPGPRPPRGGTVMTTLAPNPDVVPEARVGSGVFQPRALITSLPDAVRKLDPRQMWRNPVMFVVLSRRPAHDGRRRRRAQRVRAGRSPSGCG